MFNELDRLTECQPLHDLLAHYADLGAADRQIWQDRCMQHDECDARELTRLHGELMAYGWLEQNTGIVGATLSHPVPACYRVTTGGLRALKEVRAGV